jgi:hypothetical protein
MSKTNYKKRSEFNTALLGIVITYLIAFLYVYFTVISD